MLDPTEITASQLYERDRTHVWHPWSPLSVDRAELMFVEGKKSCVRDASGKEYIDCSSLNSTTGFRCEEVIHAVTEQLHRYHGTDISIAAHDIVGALAERLADLLPGDLSRSLFVNSGSEAIEAALFMATSHWSFRGETRRRFVTFQQGYHGSTIGCRSLTGLSRVSHPFADPFDVTKVRLPFAPSEMRSEKALVRLIGAFEQALHGDGSEANRAAAVVVEPLLNVAGGIVLPEGFLPAMRKLCDRYDVLLIIDEVFTAYGRCGAMFASNQSSIVPDILVSSKGLASGYMPIAAVSVNQYLFETFAKDSLLGGLRYGHTTSGHAPACAAAMATLDILERDGLVERARISGAAFREAISALNGVAGVVDCRGVGQINVLEMDSYQRGEKVVRAAREKGLLLRQPSEAILICPPLVIDDEELRQVADILQSAVWESGQ